MTRLLSLVCLLCLAAPNAPSAPPPLTLPPEVHGEPGRFVAVAAETTAKGVLWHLCDPGLDLFPPALLKDTKTAVVVAARPGRYRLAAFASLNDEAALAETVVVIDGPAPPPPPSPNDPFFVAVKAAYMQESDPQKGQQASALAALYRRGASTHAPNAVITQWGPLFDALAADAAASGVKGKLMAVQGVIQSELVAALPTGRNASIDDAGRQRAAAEFVKVATALEAVNR